MNRCLLLILGLFGLVAELPAQSVPNLSVGSAIAKAAQNFLASLDDRSRSLAVMTFDNPARLDWHNIPKPVRKGIQLRDMNAKQKEHCHQLLKLALSESGYVKAVNIMALEHNLKEGEKDWIGSPLRDPERYFLTIFGKPELEGTWGWSFEGHHLSLNFVIRDGEVISDTPNFWGSNPAIVKVFVNGGPQVKTRTLADEEQFAFELINALDDQQREVAVIADTAPGDYRFAGMPQLPPTSPEGIAGSEMTENQKAALYSLIKAYCNHFAPELASKNLEQITIEGLDHVHFAWAGSTKPGVGHYYRVQGLSFVLEFVNVQSDPQGNKANHIHSVWRNLRGDFGQPIDR